MYENNMKGNKPLEQYGFRAAWQVDKKKAFCMHVKWPTSGEQSSWVTASGQELIDIQSKIQKDKPDANFVSLLQSNKDKQCIGFISHRRSIVCTPVMDSAPATLYTLIKQLKDTKQIKNLFKLVFAIANNTNSLSWR